MGIKSFTINVPPESIFTKEQLQNGGPFSIQFQLPMPGEPVAPEPANYINHRNYWPEDAKEITQLLLELKEKHDPRHGGQSSPGKNIDSDFAIHLFESLGPIVVGWAFNHRAGRAIDLRGDRDSHHHEKIGRAIQASDFIDSPVQFRPALAALVASLSGLFPRGTAKALGDALIALNWGETTPILAAIKTGKHGRAHTLWQLRLYAVCYCEFLRSRGEANSKNAESYVGKAYGIGRQAVGKWKDEVSIHLGEFLVQDALATAARAGLLAHKFPAKLGDPELLVSDYFDHAAFTDNALQRTGRAFQTVWAESKQSE